MTYVERVKAKKVARFFKEKMEPERGIEPPTFALQKRCSTAELLRQAEKRAVPTNHKRIRGNGFGVNMRRWPPMANRLCQNARRQRSDDTKDVGDQDDQ